MTSTVTVDAAGALMGGAARFLVELRGYLGRTGADDVESSARIGGSDRAGWYAGTGAGPRDRRVALDNVGFVAPGGQRWTLLAMPCTSSPRPRKPPDPAVPVSVRRDAVVVRLPPAALTSSSSRPRPWPSAS